MKNSDQAAVDSIRVHRVHRGWLLKIALLVVYMVVAAVVLL